MVVDFDHLGLKHDYFAFGLEDLSASLLMVTLTFLDPLFHIKLNYYFAHSMNAFLKKR